MTKHRAWQLLLLLFFSGGQIFSQVSQSSGPVNVCAPANISFTAPAGATGITWNFGSFGTFNTATGAFNVTSPASFSAIFSGMVGGNPVSFTVPVTVHAKPVANFSITQPANSCVVKTVTLTDQSTTSNTLASWLWTYGDGGSGSAAGTHSYGYTLPGTYSVTLKVTDTYGCDNQVTKGSIFVSTPPSAIISSNPSNLSSCNPSLVASFSGSNSSGAGTLSYNWNFGNGQTSNVASPSPVTFTAQANPYIVSLTVTANGCVNIANAFVTVSPPTLTVAVPSTVCLNASPVVTIQSNQFFTAWDLGNSSSTNVVTPPLSNPTVALPGYTSGGNYTITVTAGFGSCTMAPQSFAINVDNIQANFTSASPYISCNPQKIVTFTNQSTGNPVQYNWYYYDASGTLVQSAATNPTFTFSVQQTNPYQYDAASFNPEVFLVATSASGCRDTFSVAQHTISRPVAYFYKNKREGCSPVIVTFKDTSYSSTTFPITSYTWNNGATPPVTVSGSGFPIPGNTFTYSSVGIYRPYLIVQTLSGCIDTSFVDTVIVETPPAVSFSFSPSTVCPNQTVQITNTTPNLSSIQHWHVESDNGYFSSCVNDPNPVWKFTNVGQHTVALSGYRNGCKGRTVSTQTITVSGPIVKARYETSCSSPKVVGFEMVMQEAQTATINFGDNSSAVLSPSANAIVTQSVAHTYSASGDYTALVTAENSGTGCSSSNFTMVVRVRQIAASITGPPMGCLGITSVFSAINSVDEYTTCSRGYIWYVDGNPPFEDNLGYHAPNFTGTGNHTVIVKVTDLNGCQDTAMARIYMSDVTPLFSFSSSTVCLSNPTVQIVNSTQHSPDSITQYFWNFGNGQTLSTVLQAVPVQTFMNSQGTPSVYVVQLTATNNKGCQRTVSHNLAVVQPNAGFSSSTPGGCLAANTPTTITFVAHQAYPSYTYDYGVSPSSTAVVNFSISTYTFMPGSYTVTMHVKDNFGCSNSSSLVIYNAQIPQANFVFSSPGSSGGNSICSPAVVSFTNISAPTPNTPAWDMGTGSPVLPINVVTFPYSSPTTTVIAITLSVNSGPPYFCSSSISKNFTVYVAKADIVVSDTIVCLGDEIRFSIDTSDGGGVKSWVWDYGDATASPTVLANSSPPSFTMHAYTNYTVTSAGNTTASLIYWSSGDACKYSVERPIQIINVVPGFMRNLEVAPSDSLHCLKLPDLFSSTAVTNSGGKLRYDWRLPGGITGTDSTITHVFPDPGAYQVTLTVTDNSQSCSATTVKGMTIFPLPTATIGTGEYCPDRPFTLTVTTSPGVVSGTWAPVSGIIGDPAFLTNSTLVLTPAQTSATTLYSLNVTDYNTCVSEAVTQDVQIMLPAPHVEWDTAIVIGERIVLNGNVGLYTYTWTPETTDLSCTICPMPVTTTTNDITYTVVVEDYMLCSQVENTYRVIILPKSSVDVPTAFTPNGDGRNDVIYVDGWGIRKLNYFRIYNRWGQLIFESNDINTGWDGTYKGVPQNVETYVYEVSVQSYISNEPLIKNSTFKLLR